MKKIMTALCALLFAATGSRAIDNPVQYVNPLVGSHSTPALSTGNTYPAIAVPWGMNFWSPQTGKMGNGWAYTYDADKIRGFKQTHQPSPWMNDYGMFNLMPEVGSEPVFDEEKRASWYSHKAETSTPYYYKVYLADYDLVTEIAPTNRAAIFRFTYPEAEKAFLVVDAFDRGSYVKVIPGENKIVGYSTRNSGGVTRNFRNYFVVQFDRPFTYSATVDEGNISTSALEATSKHAGGIAGFSTKRGEQVVVRVASSFISIEHAEQNLKELGQKTLDQVAEEGRQEWNRVLSRFDVQDMSDVDRLRTFYSCLYRSVLFPRTLHEINAKGETVHYSPYNGQVLPGPLFGDTGFWDTFRALFPLVNLVYPEMSQQMQQGWANAYKESGFLPEWSSPGHRDCMVGNNSASVVADAWLKGIRGYEIDSLWAAVTHGANAMLERSASGRRCWKEYNELGYVPYDKIKESAARTLEYAYDDWCIYKLGQALGKPEKEIRVYAERAMNYRNLFDKEHNLMRGKLENGQWAPDFNPFKWGDAFTEGNSLHYTWSVFHDPQGLIDLMGGADMFNHMLDTVFVLPPIFDDSYYGGTIHEIREMQIMNMGNYAHGNQPIQHMLYMYNYSGQPWKTQYWVREAMNRLYNAQPDGYCGDEDNGQTSAWYVFTAMGFYPVCPGSGEYVLGAPYFKKMTVHLPQGKDLVISAPANSDQNRYVQRLSVNGAEHKVNYVTHTDLLKGMNMEWAMDSKPNRQRGNSLEAAPYSFSKEFTPSKAKAKKSKKKK
ncbi:MAG: GH92 family glycosyl hydrolase [Bacteroidaceae bacterium]|nr:GH92 family glycosyl hydrolase [Bacteroidaceae bacterium]